jgi:hypothetical protein
VKWKDKEAVVFYVEALPSLLPGGTEEILK